MTLPNWTNPPSLTPLSLSEIQNEFGCEPLLFSPFVYPPLPGPATTTTTGFPLGPTTSSTTTTTVQYVPPILPTYNETISTVPVGTATGNTYTVTVQIESILDVRLRNGGNNSTVDWLSASKAETYTLGPNNTQPEGGYNFKEGFDTIGTFSFDAAFAASGNRRKLVVNVIPKPVVGIPPLQVTGPNKIASYAICTVTITGQPNERVRWQYIPPVISNLYFDYYPDVATNYGFNNEQKTDTQYALDHYKIFGSEQGRKSIQDLENLLLPIDNYVDLNNAGVGTVRIKTYDISDGKGFLGRKSRYRWNFFGDKSSNVVLYEVEVTPQSFIYVRGNSQVMIFQTVDLVITGYGSEIITYTGLDGGISGTITLNAAGSATLTLTGLNTVKVYNWKFVGSVSLNTEYHSVNVKNYTLTATPSTFNIVTGDVFGKQIAFVTITGAPNETVTYTSLNATNGTIKLDSVFGRIEGDIINGATLNPGTYSYVLNGDITTNTVTLTLNVKKINEVIGPTPSPYDLFIRLPISITITGGLENTKFTARWVGPNNLSGTITGMLNSSGSYTDPEQRYSVTGQYNYTFEFEGSKNIRYYRVNVIRRPLTVEHTAYTIPASQAYVHTLSIPLLVRGTPLARIEVQRPTFNTVLEESGPTYRPVTFYEGEPGSLTVDDTYYRSNPGGFPKKQFTLDAQGQALVNVNGVSPVPFLTQFNVNARYVRYELRTINVYEGDPDFGQYLVSSSQQYCPVLDINEYPVYTFRFVDLDVDESVSTEVKVYQPAPPPEPVYYDDCKIICAKLYELGYLPEHIYAADQMFGQYLRENDPYAYYGYVKWASVVVDWMEQDGPQCMFWIRDKEKRTQAQRNLAVKWAKRIATPWAQHMAFKMGVLKEDNRAGRLIMRSGLWVSRLIGKHTKATEPTKNVALGYLMWLTFGIFWLLAGIK